MSNYEQPQTISDNEEVWAVHRASQSPEIISKKQWKDMILCTFLILVFVNLGFAFTGYFGAFQDEMLIFLFSLTVSWGILFIFKTYECLIWPEEVRFLSNGTVVLQMCWGIHTLDITQGLTLSKRKPGMFNNVGVLYNAVDRKSVV